MSGPPINQMGMMGQRQMGMPGQMASNQMMQGQMGSHTMGHHQMAQHQMGQQGHQQMHPHMHQQPVIYLFVVNSKSCNPNRF